MYSLKNTKKHEKEKDTEKSEGTFPYEHKLNNAEYYFRSTLSVRSNVISIPALLLGF
jgi:hypothetical protein